MMTARPPVSGEPSGPHPRRRLNRLHALRSKWGDCYWKPGDEASAPEWADDPCEALEPELIEFENDVRADFTALIRKAEARAIPPSLAAERALEHLQEHGCNVYHDYDEEGSCEWQQRCDEPGCKRATTMGTPTPNGYRSTCSEHNPRLTSKEERPRE